MPRWGRWPCSRTPTPAAGWPPTGRPLVYGADWVLRIYRANRPYLARAYLHSLLHCVFRHPWLRDRRSQALWGLACDIAVEDTLDHLDLPGLRRPVGWLRQQLYAEIRTPLPPARRRADLPLVGRPGHRRTAETAAGILL